MDNTWERSVPFFNISKENLSVIFHRYDAGLRISAYKAVSTGCRNSNYTVKTNKGDYFIRIFPPGDKAYLNEKAVSGVLHGKINIPQLYFAGEMENRGCLIYEYIDSIPLQAKSPDNIRLEDDVIRQAARSAAIIHSFKSKDFPGLIQNEYPPFHEWHDLFLSDTQAATRLGGETVKRVRRLIAESESKRREIDKYRSFIHGDFRPANMITDKNKTIYIVDWEFSGEGHILGDTGQFFRYSKYFDKEQIRVFETEYNKHAPVKLPEGWYDLSKLRDLVNPLQMLGGEKDRPLMYGDLKDIVLDTLKYFGY